MMMGVGKMVSVVFEPSVVLSAAKDRVATEYHPATREESSQDPPTRDSQPR